LQQIYISGGGCKVGFRWDYREVGEGGEWSGGGIEDEDEEENEDDVKMEPAMGGGFACRRA
jgi:hypothetical protein